MPWQACSVVNPGALQSLSESFVRQKGTLQLLLVSGMLLRGLGQAFSLLRQAGPLGFQLAERLRCCGGRLRCSLGGVCVLRLEHFQSCGHFCFLCSKALQLRLQLSGLHKEGEGQRESPQTLTAELPSTDTSCTWAASSCTCTRGANIQEGPCIHAGQ